VARRLPTERAELLPCPHRGCGARPGQPCRQTATPHDLRHEWATLGAAGYEFALNVERWSESLVRGVESLFIGEA
jgi:hypothetical protein